MRILEGHFKFFEIAICVDKDFVIWRCGSFSLLHHGFGVLALLVCAEVTILLNFMANSRSLVQMHEVEVDRIWRSGHKMLWLPVSYT